MDLTIRTSSLILRRSYFAGLLGPSARTCRGDSSTHWRAGTFDSRTTNRRGFSSKAPPKELTAVDLFSGIGGFSVSLKRHGFRILSAVDKDERAANVYKQNFPGVEFFVQDIRDVSPAVLVPPGTQVWCAGFDYFPRTVAGKGGRDDPDRDIVFTLTSLIEQMQVDARPNVVIMENVVHFQRLDLFMKLREGLFKLGYTFEWRIYDLARFGIPQHRKRLFMVAVKLSFSKASFRFPVEPLTAEEAGKIKLRSYLTQPPPEDLGKLMWKRKSGPNVQWRYNIIEGLEALMQSSRESNHHMILVGNVGKGTQGQLIYSDLGHANTQNTAAGQQMYLTPAPPAPTSDKRPLGRYIEDPRVSIIDGVEMLFRRLTGNELSSLQGFPKDFVHDEYIKYSRKQLGNSVPPPIADAILQALKEQYYPHLARSSIPGPSKEQPDPNVLEGSMPDALHPIRVEARSIDAGESDQRTPSTFENELETVRKEVNRVNASQLALRDEIRTIKAKQEVFEEELATLRAKLAEDK